MKKMILAVAMAVSATSAFANICEVDMVDNRTNRLITSIRAYDFNDGCKEGMKACRKEIRLRGLLNRADCVRADDRYPYPGPQNPGPQYPGPQYPGPGSSDARRMLNNGESAIVNNRYVTVAGVSFNGTYAVRSTDGWNTISNGLRREQLAVTNGCSMNLCTSDSVIDVRMAKYVKVVGIHFDERLVTQSTDGWNTLTSNVDRMNLAETKGCIEVNRRRLCVGNTVITRMNRDALVAGIQMDGNVVLKSLDSWNSLTTNVEAGSLVVIR